MKFGQRLKTKIEWMNERGLGCGQVVIGDPQVSRTACAAGTIPGEEIEGSFAGRRKGVIRLEEIAVLAPSPDRRAPECPHAGECGGCAWQHVAYPRQAEFKREMIERAFAEAGLEVGVDAFNPAEELFRHRNRMDYVFGPGGELGLKRGGRWDAFVDLKTCLMMSPEAEEVLRRTRVWAKSTGQEYWDNRAYRGYLRYLVIREGKRTGDRMALLITAAGELRGSAELVESLKPLCTSIYHGVNPLVTDLSTASELSLLHGRPDITEKISGLAYSIPPNSFFQTNSLMAERLLEHVRSLVAGEPCRRLLDLYCGTGFFGLGLAKDAGSVLGVELDEQAIAVARKNAAANGIANAEFRAEPAERLSWTAEAPEAVIVDPPRSGLHPKVRDLLLSRLPPRIVYVSCNPRALAADLKALLSAYRTVSCAAFDLFPQTPHVETVVCLRRNI